MQLGLSLALGLTVGSESTWGTSPRGVHSLWLKESKWSFVVPCHPLVTTRDHSSFSVSVSLGSLLMPYEVSILELLGADGICWWLIFLGSRQHFRLLKCTTTCCRSSFWRGQASSEIFWWWHVDPATDILVWITDPLHGGWNLFPHSVTYLVRISHSFCFIAVLVSVWHNPPLKIMCSLEACFRILHTSLG